MVGVEGRNGGSADNQRVAFLVKASLVLFATLLDAILTATVDVGALPSSPSFLGFAYIAVHAAIHVVNALLLFLMLSGTYLFQVGLLSILLSEFTLVLILIPIYLVVFLAYVGVKISLLSTDTPPHALWDDPLFFALSILHRIVGLVYMVVMVGVVFRLGQRRWYAKGPWVRRFREQFPEGGFGVTDID